MTYDETDRFQERIEAIASLVLRYAVWAAFLCAMFTLMAVITSDQRKAMWLGFQIRGALSDPVHFEMPADQACLPSPRFDPLL